MMDSDEVVCLVASSLLEARGDGGGRTYHLSAAAYRALGERAAYVRVHGFERAQAEQMVLQYVRAHGRITRGEVMQLCRLTGDQATALLSRLARGGELVLHGRKRGAYYTVGA